MQGVDSGADGLGVQVGAWHHVVDQHLGCVEHGNAVPEALALGEARVLGVGVRQILDGRLGDDAGCGCGHGMAPLWTPLV